MLNTMFQLQYPVYRYLLCFVAFAQATPLVEDDGPGPLGGEVGLVSCIGAGY
jgi:hypothetical protein